MVRVEIPKPEEGTQAEMEEEGWDTRPIPRTGVWGSRQRAAGQQERNCRLEEMEDTVPVPWTPCCLYAAEEQGTKDHKFLACLEVDGEC